MTLNETRQEFKYIKLDPRNKSYYSSHYLRSSNHENTQSMFLSFLLLYNPQDGRLYSKFVKDHNPDLIILDIHYTPLLIPLVLISAIPFGMIHYIQEFFVKDIFYSFCFGVVFAYANILAKKREDLNAYLAVVLIHAGYNLFAVIIHLIVD